MFWSQDGVCDGDEFPCDGGECDQFWFSFVDKPPIENAELRVRPSGGQGGHEQDGPEAPSSTAQPPPPGPLARLTWVWGEACQACGLFSIKLSEFRYKAEERVSRDRTEAFDLSEVGCGRFQLSVICDDLSHSRIDLIDLIFVEGDLFGDQLFDGVTAWAL